MTIRSQQRNLRLGNSVLQFIHEVDTLDSPEDVLAALHEISWPHVRLRVFGALQFPLRFGDFDSLVLGETVFLHPSVPKGWWNEFITNSREHPSAGYLFARLAIAPFTGTDLLRSLEPLGIDRWATELDLKHGIRDGMTCPVGGRWLVDFWSAKALGETLTPEIRAMLFLAATFAAIRLQKITGPRIARNGSPAALTARELAVLRLLSLGHRTQQIAEMLGLGEETVRTHLKKLQTKLGVRSRLHAVAQAIRLRIIS